MVNDEAIKEFDEKSQVGLNVDVSTLTKVTPGMSIDFSEFVGTKLPIEKSDVIFINSKFGPDGKQLPPGQEIMAPVLKVETVPVTTITNRDGEEIEIRASEMFSLKEILNDKGEKTYGWSEHEKGALNKFLKKMKVQHPKDLKGKVVLVTTRPGKIEGQEFLGFVKE